MPQKHKTPAGGINRANRSFYATLFSDHSLGLKRYYTAAGLNNCVDLKVASKLNLLPANKQAAILEIGPGDGRVINYLLEHAYTNITAIERDHTGAVELKNKYRNYSNEVTIIEGDIKEYKPKIDYDCILWMWCGFNDFSKEEQQEMLNKIIVFLKPGGVLIVDNAIASGMTNVSSTGLQTYEEQTYSHIFKIRGTTYRAYIPNIRELRMWGRYSKQVKDTFCTTYETDSSERPRHLMSYWRS